MANESIYDKLHIVRKLIVDLGESIEGLDPDMLVEYIRKTLDKKVVTKIREEVHNGMILSEWGNVIINRKLKSNKPGTASWYAGGISAFIKLNGGNDLLLDKINVTLLKNFKIEHESKGNSSNCISSYMRAGKGDL